MLGPYGSGASSLERLPGLFRARGRNVGQGLHFQSRRRRARCRIPAAARARPGGDRPGNFHRVSNMQPQLIRVTVEPILRRRLRPHIRDNERRAGRRSTSLRRRARCFLADAADTVINLMRGHYIELGLQRDRVVEILSLEEKKFGQTLNAGMYLLPNAVRRSPLSITSAARHCVSARWRRTPP